MVIKGMLGDKCAQSMPFTQQATSLKDLSFSLFSRMDHAVFVM